MTRTEQLNALKQRVSAAEKAINLIAKIDARIDQKQAEVSSISAEATGHPANLRDKLAVKLAELEAARAEQIEALEAALEDPVQTSVSV